VQEKVLLETLETTTLMQEERQTMTVQRGKRRVLVHVEELGGKRGVSGLWGCKGREKRGTS
jgi:hypothetical protein